MWRCKSVAIWPYPITQVMPIDCLVFSPLPKCAKPVIGARCTPWLVIIPAYPNRGLLQARPSLPCTLTDCKIARSLLPSKLPLLPLVRRFNYVLFSIKHSFLNYLGLPKSGNFFLHTSLELFSNNIRSVVKKLKNFFISKNH